MKESPERKAKNIISVVGPRARMREEAAGEIDGGRYLRLTRGVRLMGEASRLKANDDGVADDDHAN
eukprot:CAMPEP_0177533848 /NCGR_PEP_ID=MMETSP0369-20130122/55565_1 /TAXON_ID=447022 ORGANISM="Scrippsiella hangoei-like, Strain SHHI-4" /NCGR_SAMPLE_ID=MMETSP0369 /ASSEMBLY_ACC=CAM_ASM_000364 /LENGTH=65 /DNA_ID=CAMNT_0019015625 /DNA_START=14 /DNA_END=209 /DNA_ORIENTATION=-